MDGISGANGESIEVKEKKGEAEKGESLLGVLGELAWSVFCPEPISPLSGTSFIFRAKTCIRDDYPRLKDASRTSGLRILRWARQGSPFRALLVISVGGITLLTLSGLMVFMLFFLAATLNAIVISLLVSLAAAGGFLAIFFACVAAIYIGALSVAVFVVSVATVSAIIALLIVTGWIGFFWMVWLGLKKSASVAKHSIDMTSSALAAYSSNRHVRRHGGQHDHRE